MFKEIAHYKIHIPSIKAVRHCNKEITICFYNSLSKTLTLEKNDNALNVSMDLVSEAVELRNARQKAINKLSNQYTKWIANSVAIALGQNTHYGFDLHSLSSVNLGRNTLGNPQLQFKIAQTGDTHTVDILTNDWKFSSEYAIELQQAIDAADNVFTAPKKNTSQYPWTACTSSEELQ
jgi:hypothetical protein